MTCTTQAFFITERNSQSFNFDCVGEVHQLKRQRKAVVLPYITSARSNRFPNLTGQVGGCLLLFISEREGSVWFVFEREK